MAISKRPFTPTRPAASRAPNRSGRLRYLISGPADLRSGTPLPAAMRSYLDPSGIGSLRHPQSDSWTVPQALQELSALTGRRIPDAPASH